jgi:hypothetical protein
VVLYRERTGQLRVWIDERPETVHLFVFKLGYSRRVFTRGYHNERLATLLDVTNVPCVTSQACRSIIRAT